MPHEALREITWTMSFDRAGKTLANERKYPFIVEVPVAAHGLDVELNRQIIDFHKLPRHIGRAIRRGLRNAARQALLGRQQQTNNKQS